jgi:hypothetical protein
MVRKGVKMADFPNESHYNKVFSRTLYDPKDVSYLRQRGTSIYILGIL